MLPIGEYVDPVGLAAERRPNPRRRSVCTRRGMRRPPTELAQISRELQHRHDRSLSWAQALAASPSMSCLNSPPRQPRRGYEHAEVASIPYVVAGFEAVTAVTKHSIFVLCRDRNSRGARVSP